jgi:hypothetical protein
MDDLNRLQSEIARLTTENVKLHEENKSHRIKRKRAVDELATEKTQSEALAKQLDEFKSVVQTSPDEWKSKYEELHGKVREKAHKDAFGSVAKGLKVRDDAIDDLWTLSKYAPEGDEPDEKAILGHLEPLVKAKPYLLAAEAPVTAGESAAKPLAAVKPLPPGPGVARPRLSDAPGAIRYVSKAERRDYEFMKKHQGEIAKGLGDGSVVLEE